MTEQKFMQEHARELGGSAVTGFGLVGGITLKDANEWAALICSIVGIAAGTFTVISVIQSMRRRRKNKD